MATTSISRLSRRILARLAEAEAREFNLHLQADYRIAWITTLFADQGNPHPHVAATYCVLGVHPARVWPLLEQRRRGFLGVHYEEFFGVKPAKKPPQSVRLPDILRRDRVA